MKSKWKHAFSMVMLALAVMLLAGCGLKNSPEVTAAPIVTTAPVSSVEPVASPETETAVTHLPGDRYEGIVMLDGMEQTVKYEQIRNDEIGFEMGYNYERFERHSEPGRERLILIGDDPEHPEVYLEITRRADSAETAAASIVEALSNEYNPGRFESALDQAGNCIQVNAEVDKNDQMTIDHLQVVYIIPAPDGCLVAWAHYTMDSADAFGALYRNMMHTFVALDDHGPITSVPSVPAETQESYSERFTGVLGTEFVVPDGFVQLDESPNIGYQYTFWHPDYEIRIVVNEIAPGSVPDGAYETDYNNAKNNTDVTYFKNGENWFVQSGYSNNGEEVFYTKESSTESGLKSFQITYPTAKREFGDRITTEFEASLSF